MRAGVSLSVAAGVAAGLASRYVRGREAADRATMAEMESRGSDLGAVERVSVLPLVEREVAIAGLCGETGVSYLVRADELRILFDLGLGTGRSRTVLETNLDVRDPELAMATGQREPGPLDHRGHPGPRPRPGRSVHARQHPVDHQHLHQTGLRRALQNPARRRGNHHRRPQHLGRV